MMRKDYLLIAVLASTFSLNTYADVVPVVEQKPATSTSPVVSWISKTTGDEIKIENGTGATLNIVISVSTNPNAEEQAGVTVKNCGDTTTIGAGSSAVCVTSDVDHPVSFSSDKTFPAAGTYQITQQLPPAKG